MESVSTSGFTACVLEFGDGSNSTSEINWLALQSVPLGMSRFCELKRVVYCANSTAATCVLFVS